jgi:hypothetical protein
MLKIANSQQIICVLAVLSLVGAALLGIVLPCLIHAQNIGAEPALNKAAQEQSEGAIPDLVKLGCPWSWRSSLTPAGTSCDGRWQRDCQSTLPTIPSTGPGPEEENEKR